MIFQRGWLSHSRSPGQWWSLIVGSRGPDAFGVGDVGVVGLNAFRAVLIAPVLEHRSALMVDDQHRVRSVTPKRHGPRLARLRVVPRFRFGVRGEEAFGDWCTKAHDGGADLLACPCAVGCVGFVERWEQTRLSRSRASWTIGPRSWSTTCPGPGALLPSASAHASAGCALCHGFGSGCAAKQRSAIGAPKPTTVGPTSSRVHVPWSA